MLQQAVMEQKKRLLLHNNRMTHWSREYGIQKWFNKLTVNPECPLMCNEIFQNVQERLMTNSDSALMRSRRLYAQYDLSLIGSWALSNLEMNKYDITLIESHTMQISALHTCVSSVQQYTGIARPTVVSLKTKADCSASDCNVVWSLFLMFKHMP